MTGVYESILDAKFMPHGHCYFWRPEILWLNAVSDLLIAISYMVIPGLILSSMRKINDPSMRWVAGLFSLFVFLCGCTHIVGIWNIWNGNYLFEGILKALTAGVSIATAALMVPVCKRIFRGVNVMDQTQTDESRRK
jgi:hypothetical protein